MSKIKTNLLYRYLIQPFVSFGSVHMYSFVSIFLNDTRLTCACSFYSTGVEDCLSGKWLL